MLNEFSNHFVVANFYDHPDDHRIEACRILTSTMVISGNFYFPIRSSDAVRYSFEK